jgi:outer membrane protein W
MFHSRIASHRFIVLAVFGLLPWQEAAFAENIFAIYTGTSFARNSDLRLTQASIGTDLTVHDVHWEADPLKAAPYYGLRFTHFFDDRPNWGIGLDYTHYKMYAQTERGVAVTGTWQGVPINSNASMNQYVQHFEISHGVNLLSLNGIYRWNNSSFLEGRLQPYLGAGLGFYWPHSENTVNNLNHTTGYDASGLGVQLLGGVQYRLGPQWGLFAEVKFDRGTAKVDIANGRAQTPLRTFHALGGVQYGF